MWGKQKSHRLSLEQSESIREGEKKIGRAMFRKNDSNLFLVASIADRFLD